VTLRLWQSRQNARDRQNNSEPLEGQGLALGSLTIPPRSCQTLISSLLTRASQRILMTQVGPCGFAFSLIDATEKDGEDTEGGDEQEEDLEKNFAHQAVGVTEGSKCTNIVHIGGSLLML